jgi:arylsulfatase A-like enzyme
LKAGKGSVYEGGIRNPMIVKWPRVIAPGSTTDVPVIVDDLFPTVLEMARIKEYKTLQEIDGTSIVPVLKNPQHSLGDRSFVWHYPIKWTNNDGPGIHYYSAIRKGDWKLIYHQRTGKTTLYNLKEDIEEQHDLASAKPEIRGALARELGNLLRKWNAPMPVYRATGKSVPMPDAW